VEILQLQPGQLTRAILDVLHTLSPTKKLTLSEARRIIKQQIDHLHYTYVGYIDGVPVAIGSLIVTERLIHNGSFVGQLEDIAVSKAHQGKGYGREMVNHLIKIARKHGCYKAILDCNIHNVGFYLKCGFESWGNQMRMDLLEIS
jgi:glucosamine-phosphate N-acetyltransferase